MYEAERRYFGELAGDRAGGGGDRPALVFLHGLTYDRRQWGPVLRELAVVDPGRRTLVVDLPGHGGSPRRDSYRPAEVAEVVHGAVTAAGLDAPVLVGHSLGGVLATCYAATYPARGVVNVDQPLLVGGFAAVLRRMEPVLRGPDWRDVWNTMLGGMRIEELPPSARELVRTATTPRPDLLLGYWDEVLSRPAEELAAERTAELATIRSRGLAYRYVTGAEPDPAYRSWLETNLPEVTITVLPGSGHFPHLAHPDALARLLAGPSNGSA
ncbi:alpha/beta fold hydrolase [Plantactinospora sonchi]|uniref:Alpha/beta hydrolase n=1 Tax=Plantactinospora sonchi TaxID=1544735 RepID=A0ABU7RTF2_9ACTN